MPGTENISRHKDGYQVEKTIDGRRKYFGYGRTLIEALMMRDIVSANNWAKSISKLNTHRYIHKSKHGTYMITRKIKGKTRYYGHFLTLEEAIEYRDYLEKKGWSTNHKFCRNPDAGIYLNHCGRQRYLHTLFKKDQKKVVDHINGIRNDNRLCNLRQVTQDINCQNKHNERSSIYPGVFWDKKCNAWRCTVSKGHGEAFEQKQLGTFPTEEEAYHSYVKALQEDNRELDIESKHHKKYMKWLTEKQQATLV